MRLRIGLVAVALSLTACEDTPEPAPETVTFVFSDSLNEESFRARTSNPDVIATARAQLELDADERSLHPNGALAEGDGGVNAPWSWSFDEANWLLSELSPEVCDGKPSDVESDLNYWINDVGSFCPWATHVAGELEE